MKTVGIVVADRGAAIVHVDRDSDDALVVSGIERLPFDLGIVVARIAELGDGERFVVDAEGLGTALWAILGHPDDDEHWRLYSGRGIERQALVDGLLVAIHEGRFHFASGLIEQDAMSRALLGYRRQVREDGLIGSELVVALLLAIIPPPVEREPLIAWR